MLRIIMTFIVGILMSCHQDNMLVHKNTEFVEVFSEVPVYIETEVPTDTIDAEVWVDSFLQPRSVDGVDILWVIDTSGSMNRFDENLLLGIEAMLNALPPSGWRLAMTSNDPGRAATESQFPLVPGDDILDAESMYDSMGRGAREEGFDAAYEYIVNNPYAASWMRPDAALLIVFVSDEEEQSDDYFIDVTDFISWYDSQRGGSVFLSSIINVDQVDSVCASPPNPIDIGERYMDATSWFGGIVVDICDNDWSPGVADASNQIEPFESLELSLAPYKETIRVFIDQQQSSDWYYVESENTVYFTVIPPGGSLVEIGYVIQS